MTGDASFDSLKRFMVISEFGFFLQKSAQQENLVLLAKFLMRRVRRTPLNDEGQVDVSKISELRKTKE